MGKYFFIFFLSVLILLGGCSGSADVLRDTQGNVISKEALHNRWVIINYWAPWCEGCVKEIPELNRFHEHHKEVVLLGVNYDQTPMPDLKNWVMKERIAYPVLVGDPKEFFHLEAVDVLPVTFIISPKGRLVKSLVGPNTEKSLLATLTTLQKLYDTNSG